MSSACRPPRAARRARGSDPAARVLPRTITVLGGLALAVLGAAPGCARWEGRPLEPDVELARLDAFALADVDLAYVAAVPRDGGPSGAVESFDARDGLDESELVALALTLHPDLAVRRAELGEASALLVGAGLLPDPVLGLFARPGLGGTHGTALGLDLIFALLRPDERAARRELAEAEVVRARAALAAAELELACDVRAARLRLLAAAQDESLARAELDLRDELSSLVTKRRALGDATALDEALLALERADAARSLLRAELESRAARRALAERVGVPPDVALPLADEGAGLPSRIVEAPDAAALDARLLAGHPRLAGFAAAHAAADQALRLAAAGAAPGFGLGPAFEREVGGERSLGAALEVELPLFDGNAGALAEGEAALATARAAYVAALAESRARAASARDALLATRAEVELVERELLPAASRAERLAEDGLRAGEATALAWTTARARSVAARRELVDALLRHALAAVELDRAAGTPLVTLVPTLADPGRSDDD